MLRHRRIFKPSDALPAKNILTPPVFVLILEVTLTQGDCAMYDLIIHNCHVLTPTTNIRRNCDIIVNAGQITDIRPTGQTNLTQGKMNRKPMQECHRRIVMSLLVPLGRAPIPILISISGASLETKWYGSG